jgi:phosphohistidine phosphatase
VRTLTLLRHAKATRNSAGVDHERPLVERGRRAARQVGLETARSVPDLVLCSTARRARETLDEVAPGWRRVPSVRHEEALYTADAPDLLARLGRIEGGAASVWLIGHNPALHDLARMLARRAEGAGDFPELAERFPTAARAVFGLDSDDWSDLATARLTLISVMFPPRD